MSGLEKTTTVSINCSFIERYGQIGKPVPVNNLIVRLTNFLSSPPGARFVADTLERLTGRRPAGLSEIRAEMFQQGFFQFVFRASARTLSEEKENFCLIVSKGIPQYATDQVTADEFQLLSHYHQLLPDRFVEPLAFNRNDLTLYSSRLYPEHLELDLRIDGQGGGQVFFINSDRSSKVFSRPEQDRLLEEMVKTLTLAYEANSGKAIAGMKIRAGDFIIRYRSRDDFDMKLICVRMAIEQCVPSFIFNLVEYALGLSSVPGVDEITHLGYLFDTKTVFNGLVRAFAAQGLSRTATVKKATDWMGQYHRALDRGELESLKRFWKKLQFEAGFDGLPVYRYRRSDS